MMRFPAYLLLCPACLLAAGAAPGQTARRPPAKTAAPRPAAPLPHSLPTPTLHPIPAAAARPTPAPTPSPTPTPRPNPAQLRRLTTPLEGQIALTGRIQEPAAGKNRFILLAQRYTLPNGRTAYIAPVKPKTVQIAPNCYIHYEDQTEKLRPEQIPWDMRMAQVIGPDFGSGTTLNALEIILAVER